MYEYDVNRIHEAVIDGLLISDYKPTREVLEIIYCFLGRIPEIDHSMFDDNDATFEDFLPKFEVIFTENKTILKWFNLGITVEFIPTDENGKFNMLFQTEPFVSTNKRTVIKEFEEAPQYLHDLMQEKIDIDLEDIHSPIDPFDIKNVIEHIKKLRDDNNTDYSSFEVQSVIYIANRIIEENLSIISDHFDSISISGVKYDDIVELTQRVSAFFAESAIFAKNHRSYVRQSPRFGKITMRALFNEYWWLLWELKYLIDKFKNEDNDDQDIPF